MAEMHWLRLHHGTVSDPKFSVIARQAGAIVAEVLAVWVFLLEAASAAEERGLLARIDFQAMDCGLGLAEGRSREIYGRMVERGLVDAEGRIVAWNRRQPKRERDDHSTARVRLHRERQAKQPRSETPGNATKRHETPRGEERRVEKNLSPPFPPLMEGGERDAIESKHSKQPDSSPSVLALCALTAVRRAGFDEATAGDPRLLALFGKGVDVECMAEALAEARRRGKSVAYAIAIMENRRKEEAGISDQHEPRAEIDWRARRDTVEQMGVLRGVGAWNETEQYPVYLGRVEAAQRAFLNEANTLGVGLS